MLTCVIRGALGAWSPSLTGDLSSQSFSESASPEQGTGDGEGSPLVFFLTVFSIEEVLPTSHRCLYQGLNRCSTDAWGWGQGEK